MAGALALAAIVGPTALAKKEVARVGNLVFSDEGGISPQKLPRHEQAPISGHINGVLRTTDGSHPPAIRMVTVDFDKTLQVNAKGLPVCRKGQLEARTTVDAKRACADSIVGSGEAEVEVEFPESEPFTAKGPIYLFNGGVRGGTTTLFIHTYVGVPAPTAVVAVVTIKHMHRGPYGLHTVAEVPKIAGGAGSVTHFKFDIERKFTYKGKQVSYVTASCPTAHYFVKGNIEFAEGLEMGVTHVLPCTPKR